MSRKFESLKVESGKLKVESLKVESEKVKETFTVPNFMNFITLGTFNLMNFDELYELLTLKTL